jgi:hypothetical protein
LIDRAQATVAQLWKLSAAIAELQVDMRGSEGRLGVATAQYRDTPKARLLARLKDQIGLI